MYCRLQPHSSLPNLPTRMRSLKAAEREISAGTSQVKFKKSLCGSRWHGGTVESPVTRAMPELGFIGSKEAS